MTQKLLFLMPEDGEHFIAAFAAIQNFVANLNKNRIRTEVWMVAKENRLTDFIVPPMNFIVESLEEVKDKHWSLVLDMSFERGRELAVDTGRTLAGGYGVLLGHEVTNELIVVPSKKSEVDVALYPWGPKEVMDDFVVMFHRRFGGTAVTTTYDDLEMATQAKMVVGKRSVATYLAACAMKSVLEIYPVIEYEQCLFSKFSSPRYRMLCVPDMVSGLEKNRPLLWRSFERAYQSVFKK